MILYRPYGVGEGAMRGEDRESGALFSYVSCEARVPADHPLRPSAPKPKQEARPRDGAVAAPG